MIWPRGDMPWPSGRKSEWERLYEQIDRADAEAKRLKSLGLDATVQEHLAIALRTNSYSFRRLSSETMVEVLRSRDPEIPVKWGRMEEEMKEGRLHPRELKAFHDSLVAKNRTAKRV